jgi:hypothetical protein
VIDSVNVESSYSRDQEILKLASLDWLCGGLRHLRHLKPLCLPDLLGQSGRRARARGLRVVIVPRTPSAFLLSLHLLWVKIQYIGFHWTITEQSLKYPTIHCVSDNYRESLLSRFYVNLKILKGRTWVSLGKVFFLAQVITKRGIPDICRRVYPGTVLYTYIARFIFMPIS